MTIGHNNPPSDYEIILDSVNELVAEAKMYSTGVPITNDDQETAIANIVNLLRKETTKLNKWHKAEKQPHLDAGRAVDAKKNDVAGTIKTTTDTLKTLVLPYQQEKERKKQEALLSIRKKFGKNAILKGMNLEEGATTRDRNNQIGGHKA